MTRAAEEDEEPRSLRSRLVAGGAGERSRRGARDEAPTSPQVGAGGRTGDDAPPYSDPHSPRRQLTGRMATASTHAEAGHRQQPWPTRRWMKALPRPPLPPPLLPPLLAILRQKSVRVVRSEATRCNGGDEERSRPPLPPGTAARKTNPDRTPQLTRFAPAPPTTRSDAQGEGRGG
ncbi:unnamed protein product [Lampetra planeri]